MQHKKLFFIPILLSVIGLSSCSFMMVPSAIEIEKSEIKYTYQDYAEHSYTESDVCPSIGNPKLLIIPIWFSDSSTFILETNKETVRKDIELAYTGTSAQTGWHSVSSFYKEESKGKCNLTATVSPWYSVSSSYKTYAPEDRVNKTTELVKTASDWYFSNNPNDKRTNYDYDGNGYLDGVMLIYGAPDYGSLKNDKYSNLWAYCYWVSNPNLKNPSNPGPNAFFWASYDFMYGSNIALRKTGISAFAGGDTRYTQLDTHTYIHEMGHIFGLVDYYDYSDKAYTPAGGFSMQDYNIGGHDPYSVMALGWAEPFVPTSTCTLEIKPFQDSHDIVLLSPRFNSSPFDEYLLVEYFTPTGLNKLDSNYNYDGKYPLGPASYGIRLWHVDARLVVIEKDMITGFTTNPNQGEGKYVYPAMSNTYDDEDYGSILGKDYYDYNILQCIRKDRTETYRPEYVIDSTDLFYDSDTFTMTRYSKQFVNDTSLNSGLSLGWSFTVNKISESKASITFTKL